MALGFLLFWAAKDIRIGVLMNETGQVLGRVLFGYISDKVGFRGVLILPCMLGSFMMFIATYMAFFLEAPAYLVGLAFFGNQLFFAGPLSSIPSTMAQDTVPFLP